MNQLTIRDKLCAVYWGEEKGSLYFHVKFQNLTIRRLIRSFLSCKYIKWLGDKSIHTFFQSNENTQPDQTNITCTKQHGLCKTSIMACKNGISTLVPPRVNTTEANLRQFFINRVLHLDFFFFLYTSALLVSLLVPVLKFDYLSVVPRVLIQCTDQPQH